MIGAICGLLTTWNSFLMASPRLMMSLARANMIPKIFAKQHPVYGTPTTAMITCCVLSLLAPWLGMGLIDPLTSFSAGGYVLSWMITSFACARLRKTEPDMNRPYRLPGGTKTAWFGGIFSAVVLIMLLLPVSPAYMGNMAVILFAAWYVLGLVLYFISAGERKAVPLAQREASLFARMSDKSVNAQST
jgi:amino acid transporter